MAAALDAAEAEAQAARRAAQVFAEPTVSAADALTHSPRTHTEESIMEPTITGSSAAGVASTRSDAFPLVECETGGSPMRKTRPSAPSGRQDLNLRP